MAMRWDDVAVGARVGELDKGPITTAHIMRWSAAVENWHRIHYDHRFATGHDKLPDVLINGSWKQHVLVQLAKDALGPDGWLWKIKFRYKKMDVAGDTIRAQRGRGREAGDRRLRLRDAAGRADRPARRGVHRRASRSACCRCPADAAVPYPFVPKPAYDAVPMPADE